MSVSIASLEIEPSGWSRNHSDAPCRMLSVPIVAMIEGSRKTRMRSALKNPTASPTPTSASAPGTSPKDDVSGVIVYEAMTTHSVIRAATDTSKPPTSSAQVCPIETRASGSVASSRLLRL